MLTRNRAGSAAPATLRLPVRLAVLRFNSNSGDRGITTPEVGHGERRFCAGTALVQQNLMVPVAMPWADGGAQLLEQRLTRSRVARST